MAMGITQKLNRREWLYRKCEETRASIQAVQRESEHPAHAEVLADLLRCAASWRTELDKIERKIK